jgi:hypothetical protein
MRDESTTEQGIYPFLETAKTEITDFSKSIICNADQSSFKREMCAKCTLLFMEEKHTETAVQSVHALTHSYTIILAVGMVGDLFSCLYICLEDAKGTFGLCIQQSEFTATNIITYALLNCKVDKSNIQCFFHDTFFPLCDKNSLLFVNHGQPTVT